MKYLVSQGPDQYDMSRALFTGEDIGLKVHTSLDLPGISVRVNVSRIIQAEEKNHFIIEGHTSDCKHYSAKINVNPHAPTIKGTGEFMLLEDGTVGNWQTGLT